MATESVFAMAFCYSWFCRHLWTDLHETLAHDVHRSAVECYEEIFGVPAPKKIGAQKLPIFDDFTTQWQLWGPVSPGRNTIYAAYTFRPTCIEELKSVHLQCNLFAFCSILAECLQKIEFLISQGSVASCLRSGGYCHMGFVANFIRCPIVQNFWKSVKIWQSYREFKVGTFIETQCIEKWPQ